MIFDERGVGLSDRNVGAPTLEVRTDANDQWKISAAHNTNIVAPPRRRRTNQQSLVGGDLQIWPKWWNGEPGRYSSGTSSMLS